MRLATALSLMTAVSGCAAPASQSVAVREPIASSVPSQTQPPANPNLRVIKNGDELACIRLATLQSIIAKSAKQDGSSLKIRDSEIRAGSCIYLPLGTPVEVVESQFFATKVKVAHLPNHWWVFFTATMTPDEQIKMNRSLEELMDNLEQDKRKQELRRLLKK